MNLYSASDSLCSGLNDSDSVEFKDSCDLTNSGNLLVLLVVKQSNMILSAHPSHVAKLLGGT